jgi:hypothetical protein
MKNILYAGFAAAVLVVAALMSPTISQTANAASYEGNG